MLSALYFTVINLLSGTFQKEYIHNKIESDNESREDFRMLIS